MLDPILRYARTPYGQARFHRVGQHPATRRHRAQLAALLRLGAGEDHPTVLYIRQTLAAFEEQHSESKADYLRRARD